SVSYLQVNNSSIKSYDNTQPFPGYRSTRRERIRYPRRAFVGRVSNVTLSRIPGNGEANRHYDLIKQRHIFSNHQTVTSFLRKKFVRNNLYDTNGDEPTPKNQRL